MPLPEKTPLTPPLTSILLAVNPATASSNVNLNVTSEPPVISLATESVILSKGAEVSRLTDRAVADVSEVLPKISTTFAVMASVPPV